MRRRSSECDRPWRWIGDQGGAPGEQRRRIPMRRWIGVLVTLTIAACAPGLARVKPALQASNSDTVRVEAPDGNVFSAGYSFFKRSVTFRSLTLMHGCRG